MDHHGLDHAWDGQEVALQEAPGGSAGESSPGACEPGTAVSQGEVLARLPDLDALEGDAEADIKAVRRDGRILSHGLSTKILMAGGALLVLAAVYPFVFGGNDEPKPGTPPAPDAAEAPVWGDEAAAPLPASANVSYEPNMSFDPELPPAPDFIGAAQAPGPDTSPQTPRADAQGRSDVTGEEGRTPAADRQSQTDRRGSQARANQMMAISNLTPTPAGIYADASRRDARVAARANLPIGSPAGLFPQQRVEPGVARLEGIIEKPSVRTTYDANRSSVH
ncbi:MAG: hypothetical protein ACYSWU_03435 [Planctomycetota bacterium]|jgi:hypothetical protein